MRTRFHALGVRLLFTCALGACAVACQAQKPLAAAAPAPPVQPGSNPKPDEHAIKEDAMAAMVALSGRWMLAGAQGGPKEAPRAWHVHGGSGTCMPKDSASWRPGKELVYAPDDESVTLFNDRLLTEVTLYTYPARNDIDQEFRDVMQVMSRKTCTEAPMMSTTQGDVRIGGCVRRLRGDALLLEQALVFQRGKWVHKARITFVAGMMADAYTAAMALVSTAFAPCPGDRTG
jgi:hypothetical protein